MKQWYTKELSQLVQISVRTLHHYDKIGLLKPSLRQSNNYRLYSEKDLLKLQQIIALKFFGFDLTQIKQLLASNEDVIKNLSLQSQFLCEKAESLLEVAAILKRITEGCGTDKSIPWEKVIELIKVYQMTEQLEHAWVKEIFNPEELVQYAKFEAELKSHPEQQAAFEESWSNLVEELKSNLQDDPNSEAGIRLGKQFMVWVNEVYGKKYAHLRTKKFEKGFQEGRGLEDVGMTPEMVSWIDKAIDAYWRQRIYGALEQVGNLSSSYLLKLWNEIMDDMYGEENDKKLDIPKAAMQDDKVSLEAKKWLKTVFKL